MELVRTMVLRCMLCNIQFKAVHIEGKRNGIADAISRRQWERFRMLAPDAALAPSEIPEAFQDLVCSLK